MKKLFLSALLGAAFFGNAHAQEALVVATCGTTPTTYTAGQMRLPTVDVNGKLCLLSSGPAGGDLAGTYPNPTVAKATFGVLTSSTPLALTQTWNSGATTFTGIQANITDTASASASLLMDLQVGGVSKLSVSKAGQVVSADNVFSGGGSILGWASRSRMLSPADGQITLLNNAQTGFTRLNFGGTTSSFPALKVSGAALQARLADDSAFAPFASSTMTVGAGSAITSSGPGGALVASAFTDTTNAANISSGTLPFARLPVPARNMSTPANPTGTSSTTQVMSGLAGSITPATSGKVLVTISGYFFQSTATAGCGVQIRYGTGAAPANGAAATGTTLGQSQFATQMLASQSIPFHVTGYVSGLTLSTAYWVDLGQAAVSAGTCSVFNPTVTLVEL